MIPRVQQLGDAIETNWCHENFNEQVFPQLASQALAQFALHENLTPRDITTWLLTSAGVPKQRASSFGQPPILAYASDRFLIEFIFWIDATTSIHQHAFSGAFQVFTGSSVHTVWHYEESIRLNKNFTVGHLNLQQWELLSCGDIRPIVPGLTRAHALFHLDAPSITVVVRTWQDENFLPQFTYQYPHFGYDATLIDARCSAQLLCLASMRSYDASGYELALKLFVESRDFLTAYRAIAQDYEEDDSRDRLATLIACAKKRHGHLAEMISPVVAHAARLRQITEYRSSITNNEHRFFLALLLNLSNRQDIFAAIESRFSGSAPSILRRWLAELLTVQPDGTVELFDVVFSPDSEDGSAAEFSTQIVEKISLILAGKADELIDKMLQPIVNVLKESSCFSSLMNVAEHRTEPTVR